MLKAIKHKISSFFIIKRKRDNSMFLDSQYTEEEGNDIIYRELLDNKPRFIGRFGTVELAALYFQAKQERMPWKKYPKSTKQCLSRNSGMFSDSFFGRHFFIKTIKKVLKKLDYLCIWQDHDVTEFEQYLLKKYSTSKLVCLPKYSTEPFRYKMPWTQALEGKNVLIINPNDELIREQFEIKDKLFGGKLWPDFTLLTYKPIDTSAGNRYSPPYKSWKKCLQKMVDDINKIDFDVALVSCGSYGMPICSAIFESGKTAIYVGGVLQFMFGITGKRFEEQYDSKWINEYFKRPLDKDKPKAFQEIEEGCYW